MLEYIRTNLLVNLQVEKAEGQEIREDPGGPATARQSRKQFKEIAELVMAITEDLEGKK